MNIKLPKLRKVGVNRSKKKIFLICDDINFQSGVATIARELVFGTADKYDWVQLAAALKHPEHGKIFDISQDVEKITGFEDVSVKLYAHTGYGSPDVIREIISYEKPDAILLITDPRFFGWLMPMEHELKTHYKIPLVYINVWDQSSPIPHYNGSTYASCDMLFSINKGTKVVNSEVLRHRLDKFIDLDSKSDQPENGILLKYLPHGLNPSKYYKIDQDSPDWEDFVKFKSDFYKSNPDIEFIVFYNSRNIRRKQPGDIILAYKKFCDSLPPEEAKKMCLFMKTHIVDENGTDLMAVKKTICPKYKVLFNEEFIPHNVMNWFYNIADCTIFMSSAEGFGLAANESLLSETMVIAPVTGGLQDQMRFEDENGKWIEFNAEFSSNHRGKYKKCGEWAKPLFPRTRALQGSVVTPYIFDDYCDAYDAAKAIESVYKMPKVERERCGKLGREWVTNLESGMSSPIMCEKFDSGMKQLFDTWKPKSRFELIKVDEEREITELGITW